MNKLEFEAEVADFCRVWLQDFIEDYHVGYNDYDDGDIEACIDIECPRNRRYALSIIPHPDRENDIAIRTVDADYVEANGEGLYLWLWVATLNMEDALMRDVGLMRMGDGSVTAQYFVGDGRHVYLGLSEWKERRKQDAKTLDAEEAVDIGRE